MGVPLSRFGVKTGAIREFFSVRRAQNQYFCVVSFRDYGVQMYDGLLMLVQSGKALPERPFSSCT